MHRGRGIAGPHCGSQGHEATRRRRLWVYDQPTGALYQVSEAGSALGVAVGDGHRRYPTECVCVERQRLQRLQQPERRSRLWAATTLYVHVHVHVHVAIGMQLNVYTCVYTRNGCEPARAYVQRMLGYYG